MPDLADGEMASVQGSARLPYQLKNVGGVYSCTCPAWRNQSVAIERRTCKHLRAYRGTAAEDERIGTASVVSTTVGESDSLGEEAATRSANAPAVLLADRWENDRDLAGWWISEKLDGVRAWWDGRGFVSRQGNRFYAPDWFTAGLPNVPLDGELWLDRKAFQRTVSIVRRQDGPDDWRRITFMVFDAPAVPEPFEARQQFLSETFDANKQTFARVVDQLRCDGIDHLRSELARVEALGGEGLMLREPGSDYQAGRSATLLKVKTFHDAEAVVIEQIAGKGRHRGRMGALRVQLPGGVEFSVGTGFSDAQREHPPALGSSITFRYQELTDAGVPRFPSFVRITPPPG